MGAGAPNNWEVQMYVYFIAVLSGDPFVKVGYAINPVKRLADLQVASPYEMRLISCIRGGPHLEKEIHEDLKEDHIRGEWFNATERMDKWFAVAKPWKVLRNGKHGKRIMEAQMRWSKPGTERIFPGPVDVQ